MRPPAGGPTRRIKTMVIFHWFYFIVPEKSIGLSLTICDRLWLDQEREENEITILNEISNAFGKIKFFL